MAAALREASAGAAATAYATDSVRPSVNRCLPTTTAFAALAPNNHSLQRRRRHFGLSASPHPLFLTTTNRIPPRGVPGVVYTWV